MRATWNEIFGCHGICVTLGNRAVVGGNLLARSVSQLAVLVLEDVMLLHAEVPPVVHDVQGG